MKKLILATILLGLMVSVSMAVPTNPYSPDTATIQGMTKTWDGGGTTTSGMSKVLIGNAVRFGATIQSGDGSSDGWASTGWGYPWPTPVPVSDLSSYDGYALTFMNTNDDTWLVNLYMNTGWVDAPYNEPDGFYQNGWTEIAPGVSKTVVLDFASADLYIGGVSQGLAAVANTNHVTNFGFQVGGNMDVFPFYDTSNPSNPDHYSIDVSQTIPAPGAILLGSIGVGLVGWLRRRRTL